MTSTDILYSDPLQAAEIAASFDHQELKQN
jgi:hypothetical protein